MDPEHGSDARRQVALAGWVLHDCGLSDYVWGHVSLRDGEGRGVWMKPSGVGFEEVGEDDVLLVAPDGSVLVGDGPRHSEYPIHTEVLSARPELASVVHVHPPHAIALAASAQTLEPISHVGGVFSHGLRRWYGAPGLIDTPGSGQQLARELGQDRALLLVGHGIVAVGASLGIAVTTAIMLEQACRVQLLAQGFGGVAAAMDQAQAARAYAHTLDDSFLLAAWRYLARRAVAARSGR